MANNFVRNAHLESPIEEPIHNNTATAEQTSVPVLGEDAQAVINCNQRLKELGIEETIKLPQIVVIGDQSTGKSSLIEAISTIKVPKAAGLCTRCPIAINLSAGKSPDSPWECAVYTEQKYDYNVSLSRHKKVTRDHPLGPWTPRPETKATLIKVSHSRDEVCELIATAQHMLLNPTVDTSHDTINLNNTTERFSPNVIRLDISQGGWPNLSFVDLPGVIQSAGRGQPEYYVKVVKALAEQYASNDNNIIILTLPINHDVPNSGSYGIAEKKASTRTIAVFTKVDIARPQERDDCLEHYFTSEGKDNSFTLGSHIVMLADSSDKTTEECLNAELSFFRGEPWSHLPHIQACLGIEKLQQRIRTILFEKIRMTLPSNLASIQARMQEVQASLADMPDPSDTTELPWKLRELLYNYATQLKQMFSIGDSRGQLLDVIKDFRKHILADAPKLLLQSCSERLAQSEAERRVREGSSSQPMQVDTDNESDQRSSTKRSDVSEASSNNIKRDHSFRLDDIRNLNESLNTSNLPGEIEPKAIDRMNALSVQQWHLTVDEFHDRIASLIKAEVTSSIRSSFGSNSHLALYEELLRITSSYLEQILLENKRTVDTICDTERNHPFTFDEEKLKDLECKSLAQRRQRRVEVRLDHARALQAVADLDKGRKKKPKPFNEADFDAKSDEWDTEVRMSAKTRAYYGVAAARFVDNVCQTVFKHLIPKCHALVEHIMTELGLDRIETNRAKIVDLMTEDPERERERTRLKLELQRLHDGHGYIEEVLGRQSDDHEMAEVSDPGIFISDEVENPPVSTPVSTSPRKRKNAQETSAQAATDSNDVEQSPTKKTRRQVLKQERAPPSHTTLTDRFRSVELE